MNWKPVLALALLVHPVAVQCAAQNLRAELADLFTSGVQAQKSGQLDAAEKAFLQVLRQGGKVAFVYNNLGIIYQQRGDHARAIPQFRQALRLQADYVPPRILLAASLLAVGKIPEATSEAEQAVKLEPREPLARLQLARCYERAGKPLEAVDQLEALREMAPSEPEYAYQLGKSYLNLGAWCFQQIKQLQPDSARLYQIYGENYYVQGAVELAISSYRRAAAVDPSLEGIHLALARIYQAQGKAAEALREIELELAIVPESVATLALKRVIAAKEPRPQ